MSDGWLQLQTRVDQLTKLNSDNRRRASLTCRQAQQLIEDKAELQALLHDRDHEIARVRDRLKRYIRDAAADAMQSQVLHFIVFLVDSSKCASFTIGRLICMYVSMACSHNKFIWFH